MEDFDWDTFELQASAVRNALRIDLILVSGLQGTALAARCRQYFTNGECDIFGRKHGAFKRKTSKGKISKHDVKCFEKEIQMELEQEKRRWSEEKDQLNHDIEQQR